MLFLTDRRFIPALMAAAVVFCTFVSGTTPAIAAPSAFLPAACDLPKSDHYATKGEHLYQQRDYADAFYALASSLALTSKCAAGTVSNEWIYAVVALLASSQLGNRQYDNAETLIGSAREVRAKIVPASLQVAQRNYLSDTDQFLQRVEHGVIEAKAAAVAREQYRPTYVPPPQTTYYESGAPDCDDYTIDEVHRDGKVITMLDGSVFLVSDVDEATSSIWLTADDVKACSNDGRHFKLIDGDDDVYATKVQ